MKYKNLAIYSNSKILIVTYWYGIGNWEFHFFKSFEIVMIEKIHSPTHKDVLFYCWSSYDCLSYKILILPVTCYIYVHICTYMNISFLSTTSLTEFWLLSPKICFNHHTLHWALWTWNMQVLNLCSLVQSVPTASGPPIKVAKSFQLYTKWLPKSYDFSKIIFIMEGLWTCNILPYIL